MNRADRRALPSLPLTAHPWEVALVAAPLSVEGVTLEGLLAVVERGSGHVRWVGVVERGAGLWTTLRGAFFAPASPQVPARPPRLLVADATLAARLSRELDGAKVRIEVVDRVPAVDEAVAALFEHLAGPTVPGITTDLEVWKPALAAFTRLAPWRALPDSVVFRLDGPMPQLDGCVAIVLGNAGQQRGIALYPSADEHRRFLAVATAGDLDGLRDLEALNLYLDLPEALEPEEARACTASGLVTPEGLCPRVVVLAGGTMRSASPEAQRAMLATLQALTALVANEPGALVTTARRRTVSTIAGRVTIASTPAPPEALPPLVDADHAVTIAGMRDTRTGLDRTGLVIKLRKADAVRVARRLGRVDRIEVGTGPLPPVVAWAGSEVLGPLVQLGTPSQGASLRRVDRALLCIASGGSRRASLRPEDLLLVVEVAVGGAARAARHDAVFDGPRAGWPKASETLLHFAEPALGPSPSALPRPALQRALGLAETVWNAVVLADYVEQPGYLAEIEQRARANPGAAGPILALVARKRALFGGDPRVFRNTRVEPGRGPSGVYTESALPEGYSTASTRS